ncbi:transposase [Fusarium oxysporum f. sp. phaseoli]
MVRRNYTEDDVAEAIFDTTDRGLSQNEAAQKRGVPQWTISRRLSGQASRNERIQAHQRIPKSQEETLIRWVLRQESLGYAPSHSQVRACVEAILEQQGDNKPLGKHWTTRENEYGWIKPENTVNVDEGGIMVGFGAYRKELQMLASLTDSAPVDKVNFIRAYAKAREAGMRKDIILSGWRFTGNWPINRHKALTHPEIQPDKEKLLEEFKTPSPPQLHSDDTPKTSRQVREMAKHRSRPTRQKYSKIAKGLEALEMKVAVQNARITGLEEQMAQVRRGKKRKAVPNPNRRFMALSENIAAGEALPDSKEAEIDVVVDEEVESVIEVGVRSEDESDDFMVVTKHCQRTRSDLDSQGFPSILLYVEDIANSLLANRNAPRVGKRWAQYFVKRQPELETRLSRRYDYQRAKCEDPTIIRGWFRLVENTIAKYGIRSDDIWNFDETGSMMGVIEPGIVVTSSHRQGRPKQVQPGNREWITVIEGISAEGQSIPPFIIGADKDHLANWYQECDLPGDWVIALSENGWTNNKLGLEWLKHFNRATAKRSVGSYRLLILDGHESHHSIEFEEYCKENKIITLCMPAHASHLLQPLDVGCFGPLKKAYGRQIEHLIRCSITHISKTEFFPAFYAAHQAAITESNIKGGFRGAGLAPFDPENVISKLDVQLRTPTPPVEVTIPSTLWTARTPKTPLEAQSHSKYLQGRIRNHKSSSPESIIKAGSTT